MHMLLAILTTNLVLISVPEDLPKNKAKEIVNFVDYVTLSTKIVSLAKQNYGERLWAVVLHNARMSTSPVPS